MTHHINNWHTELLSFIGSSKVLCIAIFNINKELVYANQAMKMFFKDTPQESLINPSLEKLIASTKDTHFEGIMTIGSDYDSNTSIDAMAFQKQSEILIVGEVDTATITHQNINLAKLNREVNNLQRQVIKEKIILKSTNAKLDETLKKQNLLLGTAAHDLRNPIGSTFALAELITDNKDDYEVSELINYFNIIKGNTKYALALLNDLLDFSSIKSGKIELNIESTPYNKLIRHCIDTNSAFAKNKNIQIKFTPIPDCIDGILNIDPIRIEQALNNLISNAIKYSETNTEIAIRVSCSAHKVKTEIIDHGMGISPDEINKLFQPFSTTSNKSTGGEKSTGLGLSITKKVIELHQGTIGVESEKGKGSNFFFELPRTQQPDH